MSAGEPYAWEGKAVLNTQVRIAASVTVNGTETPLAPGSASFSVIPREGHEWTGLRVEGTAPEPVYVSGPPLLRNPFPDAAQGSLASPDGALGKYQSVHTLYWGTVTQGPNTNLVWMKFPADPQSGTIYVHALLQQGSMLYRAQRGNQNLVYGQRACMGSDISHIREGVIAHENLHYSENVKYFETHDVQKALEGAHAPFDASSVGQPGSNEEMKAAQKSALQDAYEREWEAVVSTAVDRDHPVDIPGCKVQLP